MTVAEAILELCRRNPSPNALLSPEAIAPLADAITGSSWSDATILPGHEEEWLSIMNRHWNRLPVSDKEFADMEKLMIRPNRN